MSIEQQLILEEIRSRCDIVDTVGMVVPLKKSGSNTYKGLCPFHTEKTPSFQVDVNKQMYYCFGCGKGGDVFNFIMDYEGVSFNDAKIMLAARVGVVIPEYNYSDNSSPNDGKKRAESKETLYRINEEFCKYFENNLKNIPNNIALEYLKKREIDAETINKFRIGYVLDEWQACLNYGRKINFTEEELIIAGIVRQKDGSSRPFDHFKGRLVFAIENDQGRVVGFSGRSLEENPQGGKYINTTETPIFKKSNLLYALSHSRKYMKENDMAILCEGQLDAIAFHRANISCAVAPQGTAFTENQARLLKRYVNRVYLAFDSDNAGQKAIIKAIEILLPLSLEIRVINIPNGKDPDELYRNGGANALTECINNSISWLEMICAKLKMQGNFNTPNGKAQAVNNLLEYLNLITNRIELDSYLHQAAILLGIKENLLFEQVKEFKNKSQRRLQSDVNNQNNQVAIVTNDISIEIKTLLKLAINYELIAKQLCEELPPDALDENIEGVKILNKILSLTANGEHKNVVPTILDILRESPNAEINKLLIEETIFNDPDKALSDTLETMRLQDMRNRRDILQQELLSGVSFERQLEILKEIDNLKR